MAGSNEVTNRPDSVVSATKQRGTTYKAPQKRYYWTHSKEITERTREYKKEYNREYYQRNKARLNKLRQVNQKKQDIREKAEQIQRDKDTLYRNISKAVNKS